MPIKSIVLGKTGRLKLNRNEITKKDVCKN